MENFNDYEDNVYITIEDCEIYNEQKINPIDIGITLFSICVTLFVTYRLYFY